MTGRDWRAAAGTTMAITGGVLLMHDLWTGLRTPRGGSNPCAQHTPEPRLFSRLSPSRVRYVGRRP